MTAGPLKSSDNRVAFRFATPTAAMEATGERFVSSLIGDIQSEHFHRYLFALRFCVGRDILDVASGEGYGSALLGQAARSVLGVDIDQASVDFANTHYLTNNVSFRRGDATLLPIADSSVDVVVSFETIEHLVDHAKFISEIRRVLRPDGMLIISSPDKGVYSKTGEAENPFHLKELGRAEFLRLLQSAFPYVTLHEQRALHGSVILPASETSISEGVEGFDTQDGYLFERTQGVPAAPYLVAVCAITCGQPVVGSVLNTPRLIWHLEEMRQRAEARIAILEHELGDALHRGDVEQAAREEVERTVLRLGHQLAEADQQFKAQLHAVEWQLAEAHRERDDSVSRLAAERDAVLASTSWRVTAPLRALMSRMPRVARLGRRGLRGFWWLVTGQLPSRLQKFLAQRAEETARHRQDHFPFASVSTQTASALRLQAVFNPAMVVDGVKEWARYEPMKKLLLEQKTRRMESVSVKPIPMIQVAKAEVDSVLPDLFFPVIEKPIVSIIVPAYNNIEMTIECLLAVRRHTAENIPYEVILADDASTDATQTLLSRVPGLRYIRNQTNLHFIRNCNEAAAAAHGEFILFLNNDVQVLDGWLAPLLEIFRVEEKCGAAGPRILYPSGHLQEAGVRIEPDASATMLGLNDDPNLPQYCFNRRVDYCSGAALIVRRSLWEKLGGFSEDLIPAYCEDMDLSLRLQDAGHDIWYVANSVVVHHLSRTTDSDGNDSKLQMVLTNQQKVVERWQPLIDRLNEVRIFAFYLPQFHPIPENDRWWGEGFTEWTNVTRAVPQYDGHYQPQLPGSLGFYDLRLPEVMELQAELARRYGVEAFCYYYYWFSGKRLLQQPIEAMLNSGRPDFPFFLCWANENWTRRWDGRDAEILIAQQSSAEDDEAVIRDLIRYMRDPRYVRLGGRPLVLVYRVDLLPDFRNTANIWRRICREEGIGEIFLAGVDSFAQNQDALGHKRFDLDGRVQFPPHGAAVPNEEIKATAKSDFKGHIYDYEASALAYADHPLPATPYFPAAMPAWDNTARRMEGASIFHGSSPGAFQAWLETAIEQSRAHNGPGERIVFVNAWNEWAEGAQLEPDRVFGHGRLEALRAAKQGHFLNPRELS